VISDASSDATDNIVRRNADQGVELLRMPERGGKNRAENAAAEHLRGEIVVNTDASIRIAPKALRRLVAVFRDPAIGVASGRDVSVEPGSHEANVGEAGYVGYEMGIRDLETRVNGIIGSSGCFYAIRPELHKIPLPENLSRDFSSALHAEENGFRAVSVPGATCLVPRGTSLRKEYRRKVRTITRGMQTLWFKRHLLNPLRHGYFAWMLWSHKVVRWALPWFAILSVAALGVLAPTHPVWSVSFGAALTVCGLASAGWTLSGRGDLPRVLSIPTFLVMGNLAAAHALLRAVRGGGDKLWEPTRRTVVRVTQGDNR
jgi:cellulose synthase/poly-beta-1,6-N-acetylglucosamine synthase-like glycosyltransferase